jgi:hypothetical protein
MLGRFDPETAWLRVCVMQRKVANKIQMIHHQLTGPTTASRLERHTLHTRPLRYRSEHERVTEFLDLFP